MKKYNSIARFVCLTGFGAIIYLDKIMTCTDNSPLIQWVKIQSQKSNLGDRRQNDACREKIS